MIGKILFEDWPCLKGGMGTNAMGVSRNGGEEVE